MKANKVVGQVIAWVIVGCILGMVVAASIRVITWLLP